MKSYQKHLIECQCILPIFKDKKEKTYHRFVVFSTFDEDIFEEKYAICNNCGIVHKITEIGQSEILWGKEDMTSLVTTIEDIRTNLENFGHEGLVNVLTRFDLTLPDWEIAEFLIENNQSGIIVLEKEKIKENFVYKYLEFDTNNRYKIKKELQQGLI